MDVPRIPVVSCKYPDQADETEHHHYIRHEVFNLATKMRQMFPKEIHAPVISKTWTTNLFENMNQLQKFLKITLLPIIYATGTMHQDSINIAANSSFDTHTATHAKTHCFAESIQSVPHVPDSKVSIFHLFHSSP